ncbi:XRE family transcriptional regulator [Sphingomonas sp. 8AM]|uniref:XRE family transcriptional regulator n=1 Tax=Sphingomonas sp. 8AM TaxID=2653170 RepID=UPI0012EF67D7|nr:S24 family peptidase [Sphingomonas sp. 8AM]VXC80053.1 Helix-turn-helix transcriptional regulator [Sphingomonas sp. 8AM]
MQIGERIAERLAALGMSQSELARQVGVAQTTINGLVKGESRSSAHLHKIARVLGTSVDYLAGETNNPSSDAPPAPSPDQIAEMFDLVPVASIDMAYGMGGTFADGHINVEVMHFPRTWLEAMTRTPPASLTWARGRGNSMSPTIEDDDIVLIDRSDRRVQDQDAIWAFTIGDIAMMKRLRVRGEKVTILSDNDRVPPDEAHPDEINVVGRVSHIIKRL